MGTVHPRAGHRSYRDPVANTPHSLDLMREQSPEAYRAAREKFVSFAEYHWPKSWQRQIHSVRRTYDANYETVFVVRPRINTESTIEFRSLDEIEHWVQVSSKMEES